MNQIIKTIVLTTNILILLIVDFLLWMASWHWGIGGIFGIFAFFIGFNISKDMTIAPRDNWRFSKYAVFKKRLSYGNSIAGSTMVIASFIFMMIDELIKLK